MQGKSLLNTWTQYIREPWHTGILKVDKSDQILHDVIMLMTHN